MMTMVFLIERISVPDYPERRIGRGVLILTEMVSLIMRINALIKEVKPMKMDAHRLILTTMGYLTSMINARFKQEFHSTKGVLIRIAMGCLIKMMPVRNEKGSLSTVDAPILMVMVS